MPSNQTPLGALPARFRRQRVLIVGCGDVGLRVARALPDSVRVLALTSSPRRLAALRASGITPLLGNLDDAATLGRLSGLAHRVIHLAPPPGEGWRDTRSQALARVLRRRSAPQALVYGSTSGVYGDCEGDWVPESRPARPGTPRAIRRVDAERQLRFLGRGAGLAVSILRIPGIYAPDREGGTPRERLIKRTPVLRRQDDVFTNHIHADDLARATVRALWAGAAQRIYNVNDDSAMKMGDYFDTAAKLFKLPKPPRVPRTTAADQLPLMVLSFMGESRRMDNARMKKELRLQLLYPTVREGLVAPTLAGRRRSGR